MMQQWYQCPNCKGQVAFGMPSCPRCGQPFSWPTQQQPPPPQPPQYQQQYQPPPQPPKKQGMSNAVKGALVLLVIFIAIVASCAMCLMGDSEPSIPKASTPDDIAIEVLGTPSDNEDSGIISADYISSTLMVEYHFYPLGLFALEEEASNKLAPMFKKVFEYSTANEIKVKALCPFEDKYGNTSWEHVLSLDITRSSFQKINWDNMADTEFYKACDLYWKRPGLE